MSQLRPRPTAAGDGMRQAEGHWSAQPRSPEPSSPRDGDGSPPQPCHRPNSSIEPLLSTHPGPEFDGTDGMDSYCHELRLPLRISPAPSEPYVLRLCIHPDFMPVPDGTIHLVRDSAIVSHTTSPHEQALVHINYELVDLWANAQRSTSPSSRSSSESPGPEAAPEGRLPNLVNRIPNPHWPVFTCFFIVLFATLIAPFANLGHPAWVLTSSTNQTAEYLVWQPTHMLYRDYEEPLLPLITFLTGADNPLLPIQPCSLITALNLELNQVGYEVAAWQGSSLPGPENGLQDRISRCQRRFRTIQLRFVTIFRNTNLLVKAKTAFALARAINEVTLDHQVIGLIKAFWVLHEGWNRHTLDELWVIRRQLRAIMNEIPSIFTEVDQGLRPHIDDPIRTWTRDAIDAIEFSREHVLPLIEWVVSLVERAITKLSSLDSRIALQVQFWRNMIVAQGITREVTCHREVDGERLYLGLVVACEEVTTHWLLDNRTVEELVNVGKRGAEMGKAITWHKDERRPYHEVRPPRPSERDKQRRN